jgi:endoglucanase
MPTLSGSLPSLSTAGAHIVNAATGARVRLIGVNRSGLEYAEPTRGVGSGAGSGSGWGFLDAAGITAEEIAAIVDGWRARVIRVPFNQDFVLRGRRGHSVEAYLAAIDQVIAWAATRGAYTLLDLQWLDADRVFGTNSDMSFNRVPALPDALSIDVWRVLAARYRDEPAVLFDIFNEPHTPMADDSNEVVGIMPGGAAADASRAMPSVDADGLPLPPVLVPLATRHVGMREWQPWARVLIDTIRAEHPAALIFVAGVGWAYDLRGMPLLEREDDATSRPLANIVYNTHVYPWCATRRGRFAFSTWEAEWDRAFGHLAARVPVFAGEWGGGTEDLTWGERLLRYFDAHDIGWCAWSWADRPHLIASHHGDGGPDLYEPTPFGAIVRDALINAAARDRWGTPGHSTPAAT